MSAVHGAGLILNVALFGEKQRLVTLFSEHQGKMRGLLRGLKKPCQLLDRVEYDHYRRLDTQLGTLEFETAESRAAWWLDDGVGVLVINWLAELLLAVLPEEQPLPRLWHAVEVFLGCGAASGPEGRLWERVVQLELLLLHFAGYGLALADDAVRKEVGDVLAYVSPKTGRAVSLAMGEPYRDRLLILPGFLGGRPQDEAAECLTGLRLTGYFVEQAVHNKPLEARQRLVQALVQQEQRNLLCA